MWSGCDEAPVRGVVLCTEGLEDYKHKRHEERIRRTKRGYLLYKNLTGAERRMTPGCWLMLAVKLVYWRTTGRAKEDVDGYISVKMENYKYSFVWLQTPMCIAPLSNIRIVLIYLFNLFKLFFFVWYDSISKFLHCNMSPKIWVFANEIDCFLQGLFRAKWYTRMTLWYTFMILSRVEGWVPPV